jgi:hypothetical protein
MKKPKQKLTKAATAELLSTLEARFNKNPKRHKGIVWGSIEKKLLSNPTALESLAEMERTGGEPDVIGYDKKTGTYTFCDCSPESPTGRRSACYDEAGLAARKEHAPEHTALGMAAAMGITLLDEAGYRALQKLGTFDTKTSSWLQTPPSIRDLGGAIFGDFRYGQVFIYHNGAQSYYSARGFRGMLKI